jgi:uncharacterized protein YdeI (YjbR/CyaY-like superfamily)
MPPITAIAAYIARNPQWTDLLTFLNGVVADTELEPVIKWGIPTYTLHGKNVLSLATFKNHCAIWFHQGVFLSDPAGKLVSASDEKTRGLRQWRFSKGEFPDKALVLSYVREAIENQKQGKVIKPVVKELVIPAELSAALADESSLKIAFEKLSAGKQREYAEYIGLAKQDATRMGRLEKCKPLILAGGGLNDRYK